MRDSLLHSESLLCPACGYDLRGIESDKCPECGLAIDREAISVSRIPWEHRREIGRYVAFWRTARLVMFHPKKFASEMNRPVDYRSARLFQVITVTLAWIAVVGWLGFGLFEALLADNFRGPHRLGWWLQLGVILSTVGASWLAIFLATGIASYWFQPKHLSTLRQKRAIALSYYAGAALGWLWAPSLMLVPVILAGDYVRGPFEQIMLVTLIVSQLLILVLVLDWYMVSCLLMGAVTHSPSSRRWAFFFALPFMWYGCLALAFLLPAALLFTSLIVLSFG